MDKPADAVVDPVPGRASEYLLGPESVIDGLLPVPDGVRVDDESRPSLLGRTAAQSHDLKDLGRSAGEECGR